MRLLSSRLNRTMEFGAIMPLAEPIPRSGVESSHDLETIDDPFRI